MEDSVDHMLLNGLPVELHYDKAGNWKHDKIYIYDCTEELSDPEADAMVNYLYEEGFILDRRTNLTIVRGLD